VQINRIVSRVLAALGRANGLNPLAERLVSALLGIDMPLRLAELARVPEKNRDGFWLAVFDAMIEAWEHDASRELALSLNQNEALSRAVDALRVAGGACPWLGGGSGPARLAHQVSAELPPGGLAA